MRNDRAYVGKPTRLGSNEYYEYGSAKRANYRSDS